MIAKIILIAIFAVASSQENDIKGYSDLDILKKLTEEGKAAVVETSTNIEDAPKVFDNYIEERLNCLKWEGIVQKQNVNKTITEAVFAGMLKNKQIGNFQCISNSARETLKKLDEITSQIDVGTEKIKEKGLDKVMPYRLIMNGFFDYVQGLFKSKSEELNKAGNDGARKKILEEVMKKMKLLNSILEQINGQVKPAIFQAFEEYINFVFATENNLKKTQREGSQKILRCVS